MVGLMINTVSRFISIFIGFIIHNFIFDSSTQPNGLL